VKRNRELDRDLHALTGHVAGQVLVVPAFTSTAKPPAPCSSTAAVTSVPPLICRVKSTAPLAALTCTSANFCVAEDVATDMVITTDPTGGASAWTATNEGRPNHLFGGAACASMSLCVAVGADDIVTSTNP
jgi:hypothetical protein